MNVSVDGLYAMLPYLDTVSRGGGRARNRTPRSSGGEGDVGFWVEEARNLQVPSRYG